MRLNYKTVLFGMMIPLRIWMDDIEARVLGWPQRKLKARPVLFWSATMMAKFASNAVAEDCLLVSRFCRRGRIGSTRWVRRHSQVSTTFSIGFPSPAMGRMPS
jgi:hypothetical protein